MRGPLSVGNLRRVNTRLCILGPGLLALLAVLGGCSRDSETSNPPTSTARPAFEPTKPLRLEVIATRTAEGKASDAAWLPPELQHLLLKGGMRMAPTGAAPDAFLLRVALAPDSKHAMLALASPDHVLERERTVAIAQPSKLGVARALADELPEFLGVPGPEPGANSDWTAFIGTRDAAVYDAFARAVGAITGPGGAGFTRPPPSPPRARSVERLEAVVRTQPRFTRARALLALGYLSLGGEDETSLTKLAHANAERAVTEDATVANAHAALGLSALRANEWAAAHERFESALALDPNNVPALEGLACLLTDAGLYQDAEPIARRAVTLQPRSAGANECLTYVASVPLQAERVGAATAQAGALKALLDGDAKTAERLLRQSLRPAQFDAWAQPMLRAVASPKQIPRALRAITLAASDGQIDASTEIMAGAALRQTDFVLNRMVRLQRRNAYAPLRILWLPQAGFLRSSPLFEEVVSAAGLPAFWQKHGSPDVCASEPKLYGCGPQSKKKS